MKKVAIVLALVVAAFSANAQWVPGTVCSTCITNSNANANTLPGNGNNSQSSSGNPKGGNSNNQTNNGNGTIATVYTRTVCGLGWTQGKVKLGKRGIGGVNQP